jgi:hypothetical protein
VQNLNWVWPLQRQEFTLIALFNTGSLWLYEGPKSDSPSPLLVARLISRGVAALALPDNFLVQPLQLDNTVPPQLLPQSFQCGKLDAGAMRPPGMWDGGVSGAAAVLCLLGVHVVASKLLVCAAVWCAASWHVECRGERCLATAVLCMLCVHVQHVSSISRCVGVLASVMHTRWA